ncbi:MAG: protein kinase [Polyangiaceae bacterium]|nr:protein kinase [Polyangiaceae bacterium]
MALVALTTGGSGAAEDLIGKTVDGRYHVEGIVGKGGMGTVYACRHVVVGKPFAMKVLRAGTEQTEGVLQRFIREAQTANSIKSRHIVEMTDFGQLPSGQFYVTMELLEGMDLGKALKQGLSRDQLFHVFTQVAEALALTHDRGIVHRDLKPDNVFLVRDGEDPLFVKLLDFGIAKAMHQGPSGLTETGMVLGTPYYMSPEQARGEEVDHRTDVYSLGVIMYRAFTGKLPFIADSAVGVLTQHLTDPPHPPSKLAGVDIPTEQVILRCMEKKREQRFQSMRELAHALKSIRAGAYTNQPGVHTGAGPAVRSGAYAAAPSGAYTSAQSGAYTPSGAAQPQLGMSGAYGQPVVTGSHASQSGAYTGGLHQSVPYGAVAPSSQRAPAQSGAYGAAPPSQSGAYTAGARSGPHGTIAPGNSILQAPPPPQTGSHPAAIPSQSGPYAQAAIPSQSGPYAQAAIPSQSGPYAQAAIPSQSGPYAQAAIPSQSGPYAQAAIPSQSGPYAAAMSQSGANPAVLGQTSQRPGYSSHVNPHDPTMPVGIGAVGSTQPSEQTAANGLAASTAVRVPLQPKTSGKTWPVIAGAVAMLAIGGVVAVGLSSALKSNGEGAPVPGSSAGAATSTSTATSAAAPPSATASEAPSTTAAASPSEIPSGAVPTATPTAKPTGKSTGAPAKTSPTGTSTARRPPEIRSPFD